MQEVDGSKDFCSLIWLSKVLGDTLSKNVEVLFFVKKQVWRNWLKENYLSKNEVWILFYKKHTKKPCISYDGALEEALCFGWIDGILKRIDDEKHKIRFTPRKPNSVWSLLNKRRAEKLIEKNKMTKVGLEKIKEAKKNGKWKDAYTSRKKMPVPDYLKKALMKSKIAWANFSAFATSYQNTYIGWVESSKRRETRKKRINEVVKRSLQNKKPGIN